MIKEEAPTSKLTQVLQNFIHKLMDMRWPWGPRYRRIKDLSSSELMRHAASLLNFAGRSRVAASLVYQAIRKDPYQLDALLCMSDFLGAGEPSHFSIDLNPYAAIVLEYALSSLKPVDVEPRLRVRAAQLKLMVRLGYATHRSGQKVIDSKDYLDFSQFDMDELSYIAYRFDSHEPGGIHRRRFSAGAGFSGRLCGVSGLPTQR